MKDDNNSKVAVIGLDGASVDLIEKWVKKGKLPNLAKLMNKGVYGRLETVPNMNSAPAWTSMMTGKNPGKHGIYYFYEKVYGSYDIRYLNGGDRKSETVWSILSRGGNKVGIINVPMTYPVEEVNGFMIAGLDAPGIDSPGAVYPAHIYDDLVHNIDGYVIQPGMPGLVAANKLDKAIERGFKAIEARLEASIYFLNKFDWDFFMVVFSEIDAAQHLFWKYMDSDYAGYDHVGAKKYGDVIYNFYQKCDAALEKLLSAFPSETTVIIHSDHGAGPAEKGACYLNSFLRHIGLLEFKGNSRGLKGTFASLKRSYFQKAFALIQKYTSRQTKEKLLKLFPKLRDKVETGRFFSNIDWSKTKVFGESSRIERWVNQKGREQQGIVEPGIEYDQLIDHLTKELYRWYDPKTGKKVVRKVLEKEEIYHGNYADKAPDLLILFNNDLMVSGIAFKDEENDKLTIAETSGDIEDLNEINGVHTDNGFYLISGKNIKNNIKLDGPKIIDLAPTILFLMGQAIPSDMDGKVIADAFEDYVRNKIEGVISDAEDEKIQKTKQGEGIYSDEDVKIIEERLRGLGYID